MSLVHTVTNTVSLDAKSFLVLKSTLLILRKLPAPQTVSCRMDKGWVSPVPTEDPCLEDLGLENKWWVKVLK